MKTAKKLRISAVFAHLWVSVNNSMKKIHEQLRPRTLNHDFMGEHCTDTAAPVVDVQDPV